MINEFMAWDIVVEFSPDDIFSADLPDVDRQASAVRYQEMLEATLEERFEGAVVEVRCVEPGAPAGGPKAHVKGPPGTRAEAVAVAERVLLLAGSLKHRPGWLVRR